MAVLALAMTRNGSAGCRAASVARRCEGRMIRTERLELRNGTREALSADLLGRDALAAQLNAPIPESWPPELYDEGAIRWTLDLLETGGPRARDFVLYYFVDVKSEAGPVVVGLGGFKGPPAEGRVEIGYSVLEPYRRRGYAAEAVRGLMAETLPELVASIGVLEKNGFALRGPGSEEGVIRYAVRRPA